MDTIRLLVGSAEPDWWQKIGCRLRGATTDPASPGSPQREAIVCLVPGPDFETVERWLRAGQHVLIALAPWWPWERLAALLDIARQAGVQCVVANPERYVPSRQLIKQQLPDKLGAVGLVRAHRWVSAAEAPAPLGLPAPLLRDLDVVRWLTGQEPERVFALERPAAAGRFVQVHLGFPGGGMALLDYTSGLPDGNGYKSLSVIGAAGAAHADDHQNVQLVYRGGAPHAVRTAEGVRQYTALVQEFIDALHAGRDQSAVTADWQGVFAVADAVQQSLASGQAVALEGR